MRMKLLGKMTGPLCKVVILKMFRVFVPAGHQQQTDNGDYNQGGLSPDSILGIEA